MQREYVLGVDIGTTNAKAMLVGADGTILRTQAVGYPLLTPSVGRVEQRAEDWWRALVAAVRAVCADAETARGVRGLALSTQGGTIVPVDASLQATGNAIVWSDHRCGEERKEFAGRFGENWMYERTGWKLGANLPALQIRHMRKNDPEAFRRARWFLSVPDYLAARLTGRPAIDLSNAGINQLADVRAETYCDEILRFAGIEKRCLAEIVPSGRPVGKLTREAAEALGLPQDTIVSSGAHDQYAVALGAGACRRGDAVIGTGTAWVVAALSDAPDFGSGFAQSRAAMDGLWGSMLSIGTGGACLDWFRKRIAGLEDAPLSYEEINGFLERNPRPRADGPMFFPYFCGAKPPLRDDAVRATLLGVDLSHDRLDVIRAIMEGVACQIVWALEAMKARHPVESLRVAGGATRSPGWMRMLANLAGRPVRVAAAGEPGCFGAAILAGIGCGLFEGARAASVLFENDRTVLPDEDCMEEYQTLFKRYKRDARRLSALYSEGEDSDAPV